MKTGFTVESTFFLLLGLTDMQVGLHRDLVACHVFGAPDELWSFDRWCWREKLNRYPQFHGMKRHRVDRSSSKMGSWRKSWHVRNFKREHDGYQQLKRKQCSTMSKYTNTHRGCKTETRSVATGKGCVVPLSERWTLPVVTMIALRLVKILIYDSIRLRE